ncbi:MAG: hypothetical protein ACD_46C00605G0002 [uncultured bacterium]|nr:MAG: hypothetical protein ACD_46C00605G0002 [uncultured bacterium]
MKYISFTIIVLSIVLLSACSNKPCSGKGMSIDTRPLTDQWNKMVPIPSGGELCYSAMLEGDESTRQIEYVGLDPRKTYDLWEKNLVADGWELTSNNDLSSKYEITATKSPATIKVTISKAVTNKGWCTVTFKPTGT